MQHFKTQVSFRILKKHLGSAWILLCMSKKLKMKFKAAIIIVDPANIGALYCTVIYSFNANKIETSNASLIYEGQDGITLN